MDKEISSDLSTNSGSSHRKRQVLTKRQGGKNGVHAPTLVCSVLRFWMDLPACVCFGFSPKAPMCGLQLALCIVNLLSSMIMLVVEILPSTLPVLCPRGLVSRCGPALLPLQRRLSSSLKWKHDQDGSRDVSLDPVPPDANTSYHYLLNG